MTAIRWQPWGAAPFAQARAEGRPVLLSLVATWCRHCRQMDRESYARDEVAAIVADRFVPVRVDADRRPDVAARYGLGGLPTIAFLTPDGEVIGGGTYVDGTRLADILSRVSHAFAAGRHLQPRAVPPMPAAPARARAGALDDLIARVRGSFDSRHGGFGEAPKFPHAAPVRLALQLHQERPSERWDAIAERTLDAMGWGPLYDEADGGFFRSAGGADWSSPDGEKLLDVNAALLQLYVDAHTVLGHPRYAARAEDVLRYVQNVLADPVDGGWAASQRAAADEGEAAPHIDRTQFADWNAAMISAALRAGGAMGDTALSQFAIRSLEHVVLRCYRPGEGMAHYTVPDVQPGLSGRPALVRGLLDDQILMACAHLDAFEATGNVVFEMMAEELSLYAIRTMWDGRAGAFLDHAPADGEIGRLRERRLPFGMNAVAARVLRRLATVSGNAEFARYSNLIVSSLAGDAAAQGPLAAEYVLAAREAGGAVIDSSA